MPATSRSWKRKGTDSFLELSEGVSPTNTLVLPCNTHFRLLTSRIVKTKICVVLRFKVICYSSNRKLIWRREGSLIKGECQRLFGFLTEKVMVMGQMEFRDSQEVWECSRKSLGI